VVLSELSAVHRFVLPEQSAASVRTCADSLAASLGGRREPRARSTTALCTPEPPINRNAKLPTKSPECSKRESCGLSVRIGD